MFRVTEVMPTFNERIFLEDGKGTELFVKIYGDYAEEFTQKDLLQLRQLTRILKTIKPESNSFFATTDGYKYIVSDYEDEITYFPSERSVTLNIENMNLRHLLIEQRGYGEVELTPDGSFIETENGTIKAETKIRFGVEETDDYEVEYIEYGNKRLLVNFYILQNDGISIMKYLSQAYDLLEFGDELRETLKYERAFGPIETFQDFTKIEFEHFKLTNNYFVFTSLMKHPLIKVFSRLSSRIVAEGINDDTIVSFYRRGKSYKKFLELEFSRNNIENILIYSSSFTFQDIEKVINKLFGVRRKRSSSKFFYAINSEYGVITKYYEEITKDNITYLITGSTPNELKRNLQLYKQLHHKGFKIVYDNELVYSDPDIDSYVLVDLAMKRVLLVVEDYTDVGLEEFEKLKKKAEIASKIMGVMYLTYYPENLV